MVTQDGTQHLEGDRAAHLYPGKRLVPRDDAQTQKVPCHVGIETKRKNSKVRLKGGSPGLSRVRQFSRSTVDELRSFHSQHRQD